jgi:hypothetical protein
MTESFSVGFSTCDVIYTDFTNKRVYAYILTANANYEFIDFRNRNFIYVTHSSSNVWLVDSTTNTLHEYSLSWLSSGIPQFVRTIDIITNCGVGVGLNYYSSNTLMMFNDYTSTIDFIDISSSPATPTTITSYPSSRTPVGNLSYNNTNGLITGFFTGSTGQYLSQFDSGNGILIIDVPLPFTSPSSLFVENNVVYLTNTTGNIYSANTSTNLVSFVSSLPTSSRNSLSQLSSCKNIVEFSKNNIKDIFGYVVSFNCGDSPTSIIFTNFILGEGIKIYTDTSTTNGVTGERSLVVFNTNNGGSGYDLTQGGGQVGPFVGICSPPILIGCTPTNYSITNNSYDTVTISCIIDSTNSTIFDFDLVGLTNVRLSICGFNTTPPSWVAISVI